MHRLSCVRMPILRALPLWLFRNAGQVCASPSRFYVHETVFAAFAQRFTELADQLKIGDGFAPTSQMRPLANARCLMMVQELLADAAELGGGER